MYLAIRIKPFHSLVTDKRQGKRKKTMVNNIPMLINKITLSIKEKWLKRLETQLNKPTNQNLLKVPKVVKRTNKKTLENFGDWCNKQSNVPFLFDIYPFKE